MPNLIEQQDLLKGLTDDRLSGLLKNPVGGIPPFLVAAEAQRRQSIRQQYSGQDQQESVVDTLTKQLSNMPQNAQPSPAAPQPQQQGIAAIQQPEQQAMRNGGRVQRYAERGLVEQSYFPSFSDFFPSFKAPDMTMEDIGNMSREEYLAAEEAKKYAPGVGGFKARHLYENPVVPKTEAQAAEEAARSPFSTPESRYDAAQAIKQRQNTLSQALRPVTEPRDIGMYGDRVPTASPTPPKERDEDAGKKDTSPENKAAAAEDEIRKRLEALYGTEDRSSWEDAQKWFAVSQQFLKPDTSLLESLVGAGQVYSTASAEEAQADRERKREAALAMLQYDIGERDAARSSAANEAQFLREQALDDLKYRRGLEKEKRESTTISAKNEADMLSSQITNLQTAIARLDPMTDKDQVDRLTSALIAAQGKYSMLMNKAGTVDYSNLQTYNPNGTLGKV